jgi:hypothetical protein
MKGHGSKFGRKKEQAIVALLTQPNIEEAAKSIGVAPNTLLRWMKEPEFEKGYRQAPCSIRAIDRQTAPDVCRGGFDVGQGYGRSNATIHESAGRRGDPQPRS